MEALEYLKSNTGQTMRLSQLVDAFEKMCEIPIEGVNKKDVLLLFETENTNASFNFSLLRQYPNGSGEYFQLYLEAEFEGTDKNEAFNDCVWSDDIRGNFFSYIKKSPAYIAFENCAVRKVNIGLSET